MIRPKSFPSVRSPETPGMRIRDVLGALRETGRPMTTREIAERLLGGRSVGDEKLLSRAGEIVGAALRKLRMKGVVRCEARRCSKIDNVCGNMPLLSFVWQGQFKLILYAQ